MQDMDKTQQEKASIPKFSSFTARKPPKTSTATNKPRVEAGDNIPQRDQFDKHSKRSIEHHRNRSRDGHHRDTSRRKESSKVEATHDLETQSSDIFFVDVKGDESNVIYGGANRWTIPKYVRRGTGQVLGAGSFVKINRDDSTERFIILDNSSRRQDSSKTGLGQRRLKIPKAKRLVPQECQAEEDEMEADFIFVEKKKNSTRPIAISVMEQVRDLDKSELSGSDSVTEDEGAIYHDRDESIIGRNAELNRLVRSEPQNLQNWLHLIEHQQAILTIGQESESSQLSSAARKRLADMRIAVYEEALSKVAGVEQDLENLWIGLLKEAALVQEFDQMERTWTSATQRCANSAHLRILRLDFVQSHYLQYGLEGCKKEFCGVLAFLKKRYKSEHDLVGRAKLAQDSIYVLLRLTALLRDAGYHELSFASWQSLIDLVLMGDAPCPESEVLPSYGEFWDSEASRLGESVPGGWRYYLINPDSSHPESHHDPEEPVQKSDLAFRDFAMTERLLDDSLALPGRMSDEYDSDDTFHLVMFSDMQDLLATMILEPDIAASLLSGFLCFLGLPPLLSVQSNERMWWSDPFLHCYSEASWFTEDKISGQESQDPRKECLEIFAGAMDFRTLLKAISLPCRQPLLVTEIAIRILRQLVATRQQDDHLVLVLVALVSQNSGFDAAAKELKRFLKVRNTSIVLYDAYFTIEIMRGNLKAATKVISSPLQMKDALPLADQANLVLLWRTWIRHYFEANRIRECIHLLMSIDAKEVHAPNADDIQFISFNSTGLLKVRQWLDQGRRDSCRQQKLHNFVAFNDIGMLLTYLEHDNSLPKAVGYANQSIDLIQSQSALTQAVELIHQSRTTVIAHHAQYIRPYIPAQIKDLLAESIALFPQNTTFLHEYANQELTFGLNDCVRSILPVMATNEEQDALPNWYFAVSFAHRRYLDVGGEPHAVRATLDRAVESPRCKYSIALWQTFLQFEKTFGSIEQYRTVLSRALTRLPWVKEIVLHGLEFLDGRIGDGELKQLSALLEEREIRTHRVPVW